MFLEKKKRRGKERKEEEKKKDRLCRLCLLEKWPPPAGQWVEKNCGIVTVRTGTGHIRKNHSRPKCSSPNGEGGRKPVIQLDGRPFPAAEVHSGVYGPADGEGRHVPNGQPSGRSGGTRRWNPEANHDQRRVIPTIFIPMQTQWLLTAPNCSDAI